MYGQTPNFDELSNWLRMYFSGMQQPQQPPFQPGFPGRNSAPEMEAIWDNNRSRVMPRMTNRKSAPEMETNWGTSGSAPVASPGGSNPFQGRPPLNPAPQQEMSHWSSGPAQTNLPQGMSTPFQRAPVRRSAPEMETAWGVAGRNGLNMPGNGNPFGR